MNDLDHNEEMLRRRLTEPLEGAPQWAEPGSQVWEGIATSLLKKPPRRRWGWWFLLPLFVVATTLILIRHTTIGTPQPEKELHEPEKRATMHSSSALNIPRSRDAEVKASVKNGETSPGNKPSASSSGIDVNIKAHVPSNPQDIRADRSSSTLLPAALVPFKNEVQPNKKEKVTSEDVVNDSTSPNNLDSEVAWPISSEKDIRLQNELAFIPTLDVFIEKDAPAFVFAQPKTPQIRKTARHQILIQAHGWGANRTLNAHQNTSPKPMDMDGEHKNYRLGLGYQWQHLSGWLLGAGLEVQEFQEQSVHHRSWQFTKANAQMTPAGYNQSLSVEIPTSLGQMEAQLRIGILEQNVPLDYQEGEEVSLTLKLDQSLKQIRIPLYTGYHYDKNNWFVEARGGVGISLLTDYDASITRILEVRNRIRIREIPLIRRPNGLKTTMWDIHGGLHIGRQLTENWKVSVGYDVWQSINSVATRPGYTTSINGHGITIGLGYQF